MSRRSRRQGKHKAKKPQWVHSRKDAPPGVRFFLAHTFQNGLLPFKDGDRKVVVFSSQELAQRCVERLLVQMEANPSEEELIRRMGVGGIAVIIMGQAKWELFQREQKWRACDSMEEFVRIEESLRKRYELEIRYPDRN